jgi:NTP pyrophosphatase (non-canonical NTP hydrolase)
MKFAEYQKKALETDKTPSAISAPTDVGRLIPLLGLAGEAGQLLAEYKKWLRDGPGHTLFVDRVAEELGDILWYVANLATKYELNLNDIAVANLKKVRALHGASSGAALFDTTYDEAERLPRKFVARFEEVREGDRTQVRMEIGGRLVGAELTDNAYNDDGYRYHDVFHIAYAAVLGWSPVLRGLLKLKRKSTPKIDEVEDGGRAAVIEEGIAAVVFDYARNHQFLEGITDVDDGLLITVQGMCAHLEVSAQSAAAWRKAILDGLSVWRLLVANSGGYVEADLDNAEIRYKQPLDSAMTTAAALDAE